MPDEAHGERGHAAGVAGVLDRLRDEVSELATLERRVRAVKKRRDLLIRKAAGCGLTEREIAPPAGVSYVRVNQIKRRDMVVSGGDAR